MTRYFTTPIYYVNDRPHLGHAYTTILADVATRYARIAGHDTFFLTGTDEHGQKVQQAADARKKLPRDHVDELHQSFKAMCRDVGIEYDRFIRTTDDDHVAVVQGALQQLYDQGLIVKRTKGGWYSVGEERFFPEKDLVDGKDPVSGRPVVWVEEENYFFLMSQYQERLIAHLDANPQSIVPAFRRQEVLGFLRQPLEDLCISRPIARLSWGIPLPFDPQFVTYVWFDALLNYLTGIGYGRPDSGWERYWAESTHLLGKDILTTHTVYWFSMLMALGVPVPKRLLVHGWWLMGDAKMSKSAGNVVDPLSLKDTYGVEVFRYFVLREMAIGQDASFSEAGLITRNNAELANDLGNLVNRSLNLVEKQMGGRVPEPGPLHPVDDTLLAEATALCQVVPAHAEALAFHKAVEACHALVKSTNRYMTETVPFTIMKTDPKRAETILWVVMTALGAVGRWLTPVMPKTMAELLRRLGSVDGSIVIGAPVDKGEPLFQKFELPKAAEPVLESPTVKAAPPGGTAAAQPSTVVDETIEFADFQKVQLRVARVLAAERVAGSDKLLKLQVDLGSEQRQIVAGIGKAYTPEALVGLSIVVVANLKPRKIFGQESCGMVLAAKDGEVLVVLTPEAAVGPGSSVS